MDKPLLCLLFFIFSVVPVYESYNNRDDFHLRHTRISSLFA